MSVSHIFPVRPLLVPANVQLLLTPLDMILQTVSFASWPMFMCANWNRAQTGHFKSRSRPRDFRSILWIPVAYSLICRPRGEHSKSDLQHATTL